MTIVTGAVTAPAGMTTAAYPEGRVMVVSPLALLALVTLAAVHARAPGAHSAPCSMRNLIGSVLPFWNA